MLRSLLGRGPLTCPRGGARSPLSDWLQAAAATAKAAPAPGAFLSGPGRGRRRLGAGGGNDHPAVRVRVRDSGGRAPPSRGPELAPWPTCWVSSPPEAARRHVEQPELLHQPHRRRVRGVRGAHLLGDVRDRLHQAVQRGQQLHPTVPGAEAQAAAECVHHYKVQSWC